MGVLSEMRCLIVTPRLCVLGAAAQSRGPGFLIFQSVIVFAQRDGTLERGRRPDVSRTFVLTHHRRCCCGLVLFVVPGRALKYSCQPCLVQLFTVMQWECGPAGLTTPSRRCHPAFSFLAATGPFVCVFLFPLLFFPLVCFFFPRVRGAPSPPPCD